MLENCRIIVESLKDLEECLDVIAIYDLKYARRMIT